MTMNDIKAQIAALDKRDQIMLGVLAIACALYLLIGQIWLGIMDDRDMLARRVQANDSLIAWMTPAVATIKGKGGVSRGGDNLSLSQLAQQAAKKSRIKMSRFQPKGNEGQVWLDKVAFEDVLTFISTLEQQYGVNMLNVAINSANNPGVVNARIKFMK
ncbi:MAG: type II secretion system protein M [Sinobacterium sp.]|nr:type II secretion system protein M [Sinobacterium sp.]